MSIIFGPVYSRRFGKSLGVDLSPNYKQCNFDCLYCELEPKKTQSQYDDVVPVSSIVNDISNALLEHKDIDFITITANGEPTLYPHLDELITTLNNMNLNVKSLILSNGANIDGEEIQNTLCKFDEVKLSLDCATQKCLEKLDRSHSGIYIENIKQGMLEFKSKYKNNLVIEVLFVKTLNDSNIEIEQLNEFLLELNPNRIDIGTIDRPPAYSVKPLIYKELVEISKMFSRRLNIYIATRKNVEITPSSYSNDEILDTLEKRPLTLQDIELLFDKDSQERVKLLVTNSDLKIVEANGVNFYKKS